MAVPIVLEDLGAGVDKIRVSRRLAEPGDGLKQGEEVVELSLPGMIVDVAAPMSGVLTRIVKPRQSTVALGDIPGWIDATEATDVEAKRA